MAAKEKSKFKLTSFSLKSFSFSEEKLECLKLNDGLNSLLSVDTKGRIDSIGEGSFRNCKNLRSINVNKDYPTVNDNAFFCCTSLKKVSFYTNTSFVAKNAFDGCDKEFE